MPELRLDIPSQHNAVGAELMVLAGTLPEWLAALPLGNAMEAGQQLLHMLNQNNAVRIEPAKRLSALELVHPTVQALTETLAGRYLNADLPLREKQRAHADMTAGLLTGMSTGYKLVIDNAQDEAAARRYTDKAFLTALLRIEHYLSQSLLECYALHRNVTPILWRELNAVFRFAKSALTDGQSIDIQGRPHNIAQSIEHDYKRIVMLALANPNHLMQGEAQEVYLQLDRWASSCEIITPDADITLAGRFYIDLASGHPPAYAVRDVEVNPVEPRVLNIAQLLNILDGQIHDLARANINLAERMRRDMLGRLKAAWGGRGERQQKRNQRQSRAHLATGLSACHYFMGDEAPFLPEQDEIRFHIGALERRDTGLSLVPMDEEPWRAKEGETRLSSGFDKPRTSRFDTDSPEMDIWQKVHIAAGTGAAARQQESRDTVYTPQIWRQKNAGDGGLCLAIDAGSRVRACVGELVTYKSDSVPGMDWHIGVIRWLRVLEDDSLEIGIMALIDEALAVATRAVQGVGRGGEYFRSLIAPGLAPRESANTLIVPASIYDLKSTLLVNLGDDLFYVRLTKLIETTKSFSQFTYQVIDTPENEQDKIDNIKKFKS